MILFFLYTAAAVSSYIYFYKGTNDTMNPFGFSLSLFLFSVGANCLKLNTVQFDLSIKTHALLILTGIEIFAVGVYSTKGMKKQLHILEKKPYVSDNYKLYMWIIVGIVFVTFFTSWYFNGRFIYGESDSFFDMKTASNDLSGISGIINYFTQILPYTTIYVGFELFFNERLSKLQKIIRIIYIGIVCALIWFVLVSRGTLLIIGLGLLYLFNVKYHFSIKRIGIVLLGFVVIFAFLMTLRVNLSSGAYDGTTNNIYFNTIYNYFVMSYNVLDRLVQNGSPYGIISGSWITLSKLFGVSDSRLLFTVDFYNSKSFIYPFYHDLGLVGVIMYPTCIFLFIGNLYKKARRNKPYLFLLLAVFQKALFVIFYSNYFFGSFSKEIPYIVTILLIFLGYKTKRIKIFRLKRDKNVIFVNGINECCVLTCILSCW